MREGERDERGRESNKSSTPPLTCPLAPLNNQADRLRERGPRESLKKSALMMYEWCWGCGDILPRAEQTVWHPE